MSLTLCQKCKPHGIEELLVAVLRGTCEGCGLVSASPELVRFRLSDVLGRLRKLEAQLKKEDPR